MAEDLNRWLGAAGLGAHVEAFATQGVDWDVLTDLTEADLRELGLSLGDRKRLLRALAALDGGAPSQPSQASSAAPSVEAERRQLTVMFIDLIDSSPLAERFDPEEMRQILTVFHEACAAAIEAHGGHIAQYSGDGLLVYFGYPMAHEDDAVRGVLAGLAAVAGLEAANQRLEAERGVRLRMRIGIETGLVVAGQVGAGATLDQRAIVGEAPIVAARLQALAPPDTVVVGPATERLIQGSFQLKSMGQRALKGVSGPIEVYCVLARSEAVGRFDIRAAGRGLTPLVGRSAELDMLRQRWVQSREGEMRGVMLVGEPGIGKSRTLRAFRDSVEADRPETILLHGSPYNRDSPFWPVLQQLLRLFALDPQTFGAESVDALEAALEAFDIDRAEAALVLSNLLGMPTEGRYPSIDTSAPSFKSRSLDVLAAMVESLARRDPVLLVFEDAHWIDPSTLDLLRLILERLTSSRLMMVITARPEFRPDWAYPHLVQLNLDRLSRRDRVEMIGRLTQGKQLPASVLDQIVAKTDGVPLFVEELTKAVIQSDLLHEAGGQYEINGQAQAMAIPNTLQGSLLARLDRLAPGVKEIAQIAATIGREFDSALLSVISAKPQTELQAALDGLVAAEIVLPASGAAGAGGAYVFRHALIQEIAYQSLLLAQRRRFHGLIGGSLERDHLQIVERQPELVAQNFAASDTPERAIDYWQQAAERALARAAFEEALAHVQAGIQLIDSLALGDHDRALGLLPLLLVRGVVEHRQGERKAVVTFHAAAKLAKAEKLPEYLVRAALWAEIAEQYLTGSVVAATALLEDALVEIGPAESVDRCRLLSRLSTTLHVSGDFERAGDLGRQALVLARRLGDQLSLLDALTVEIMGVGGRPLPKSRFAERRRVLDELSELADTLDDPESLGIAGGRVLAPYLEIGAFDRFDARLERYQEVAARDQALTVHWVAATGQAMRAILVGDFALAERKADEASQLVETADARLAAGAYGIQMFTIRREQDRLAEVAPLMKRFVDENPEDATWRPGLMLIASDLGFDVQARRTLATMAEEDFALPSDSKLLITLTYLAEVAAKVGDTDACEALYERLAPFADQAVTVPSSTLCCGSTARYVGLLAGALGDLKRAERHFEQALAMNQTMCAWPWLAHTRHDYAQLLTRLGGAADQSRAMDLTGSALATARELGMHTLIRRISQAAADARPAN